MKSFNPTMLRVECPVCKRRRPLNELEKSDHYTIGNYQAYQYCSDACEKRATPEQSNKVISLKELYGIKEEK